MGWPSGKLPMVPFRNPLGGFSESVLLLAGDLGMASGPPNGFVVQAGDSEW